MDMSPSVVVATQLAQMEAAYQQWEFVEPDHLFLGAFKLVSLCDEQAPIFAGLPGGVQEALAEEVNNLSARLRESGAPTDPVRRQLRHVKGKGGHEWPEGEVEIHRSQASHRVFRRAAELAGGTTPPALCLRHFVLALLEERPVPGEENPQRLAVLRQFKVDVDRLRESLRLPAAPEAPGRDRPAGCDPDGPDSLPELDDPPASPGVMVPPGPARGVPGSPPKVNPPTVAPAPLADGPLQPAPPAAGPAPRRPPRPTPFLTVTART